MKRIVLLLASSVILFASCRNTGTKKTADTPPRDSLKQFTLTESWRTDTVLKTPESVLYDRARDILYVSDLNLEPRKKDGNGFISRIDRTGKIVQLKWISGLSSPKGLAILGDTLFAADVDEVVAMDINKARIIKKIPVKGGKMLNDLAADNEGNLYVTDTDDNKIYKYSQGKLSLWLDTGLNGPNGLLFHNSRLLVALQGSGEFISVNTETKEITRIAGGMNRTDGIVFTGIPGYYVVSDWEGELFIVNPDYSTVSLLRTKDQGYNTADIEFIQDMNLLIVPTFKKNGLIAYNLRAKD